MKNERKLYSETKGDEVERVIFSMIHNSPEGITIAEIAANTGLVENQIWAILFPSEKMGRIKIIRQGVYVEA